MCYRLIRYCDTCAKNANVFGQCAIKYRGRHKISDLTYKFRPNDKQYIIFYNQQNSITTNSSLIKRKTSWLGDKSTMFIMYSGFMWDATFAAINILRYYLSVVMTMPHNSNGNLTTSAYLSLNEIIRFFSRRFA